jgi:hypothetical protein
MTVPKVEIEISFRKLSCLWGLFQECRVVAASLMQRVVSSQTDGQEPAGFALVPERNSSGHLCRIFARDAACGDRVSRLSVAGK